MTRSLHHRSPPSPDRRPAEADQRRNLLLLWLGQFTNTAGLMMLVPIMPFYLEQLGTRGTVQTQTWAGVAIAAPALALTFVTPLWGRIGDRVGRKWMVVRALLGLAAAMVVMAAASTPAVLVLGRLLQGSLGGVVEAAAAFAGASGSQKRRGSSLGKSFSATAAGALTGPLIGGLLVGSGGLRELMIAIAIAASILAICCGIGLREPHRQADRSAAVTGRPRGSTRSVPGAIPLAVAAACTYFGVYGLIPIFAEQVRGVAEEGAASVWVGVLHSVMWAATLLGSFWWGNHNDTAGRPVRAFALAAGGCAASIAALSLPLDPVTYIPLRLAQGFCFAALAQSLFLHFSNHAGNDRKSEFVSTANSFLLLGQSAGPLLAGPITGLLPVPAAVTIMGLACTAGAVLAVRPAIHERSAA